MNLFEGCLPLIVRMGQKKQKQLIGGSKFRGSQHWLHVRSPCGDKEYRWCLFRGLGCSGAGEGQDVVCLEISAGDFYMQQELRLIFSLNLLHEKVTFSIFSCSKASGQIELHSDRDLL